MIRHLHSSGRYNRSAKSLREAFDYYATIATIITFTEVEFNAREEVLHHKEGWKAVTGDHGNRNDAGIVWRDDLYKLVYADHFKVNGSSMKRARKRPTQPVWGTVVVLKEISSGKVFTITVIHTPSSVQSDLSKHKRTGRVLAWLSTIHTARGKSNKVAKRFNAVGSMFVADWNINFKSRWARTLIKANFPRWKMTWKHFPHGGTLGHRIIDATLVTGKLKIVRPAKLVKDDDSSDHRPYEEIISA